MHADRAASALSPAEKVPLPRQALAIAGQHSAAAEFIFAIFAVIGTGAGTALALFYAAHEGVATFYVALYVSFLLVTAIGVTGGLHRLFTHRSFKSNRGLAIFLAIAGTAAGQGFFLRWV